MWISNQKHLQQFPRFFFEKDGSLVFFISTVTPIIIFLPQKNSEAAIFRYSIKNHLQVKENSKKCHLWKPVLINIADTMPKVL